jgi:hypothetical protein
VTSRPLLGRAHVSLVFRALKSRLALTAAVVSPCNGNDYYEPRTRVNDPNNDLSILAFRDLFAPNAIHALMTGRKHLFIWIALKLATSARALGCPALEFLYATSTLFHYALRIREIGTAVRDGFRSTAFVPTTFYAT